MTATMKKGRVCWNRNRIILMGKGVLLEDVAKRYKLHPNTVRKWCRNLHIFIGLMRAGGSPRFKQALRNGDVGRFIREYDAIRGMI